VIQLSDYSGPHPEWDQIRIPQPGDSNPRARVGVLDVKTGNRVWLDPGERGEFYIPRLYWTSRRDTLAMITLDRPQQVMKLYFFDVKTGGKRLVAAKITPFGAAASGEIAGSASGSAGSTATTSATGSSGRPARRRRPA